MSAGKLRYAVYLSANYPHQLQRVPAPTARRAGPQQASAEARRLLRERGGVAVVLGPNGHREAYHGQGERLTG